MNRTLLLMALLIVAAAVAADWSLRNRWIRRHVWLLGGWFGIVALLANTIRGEVADVHILVSLRNIPVIAAGFFFDPAVGLISGAIAAIGRMLLSGQEPWWSWCSCGIGTMLVAGYAVAMKKWMFNGERPLIVTAAAASAVGELFYLIVVGGAALGLGDPSAMLNYLYAAFPGLLYWGAGIVGAASVPLSRWSQWRDWRKRVRSMILWGLLLYCGAFIIIEASAEKKARQKTAAALLDGMRELDTRVREQIQQLLHRTAVSLRDRIKADQDPSIEQMQRYAEEYDVDEIDVFAADGTLLATNLPKVAEYNRQHRLDPTRAGRMADFLALTKGNKAFVQSEFRVSRSDPDRKYLYVGIPLNDGKAFLELGYSELRLEQEFEQYFRPMFSKANIGETGYFILADASGRILIVGDRRYSEAEGQNIRQIGMTEANWRKPAEAVFEAPLFGKWGVCGHLNDLPNLRAYAVLPYEEFFVAVVQQSLIAGLVLFIIMLLFRWAWLQNARKQEKIDAMRAEDLEVAATIQSAELRHDPLETAQCRCTAFMAPAKEVGGDFYDYYELPDGRLAVTVADVSGKGIPAALFMMKSKRVLQSSIGRSAALAEALARANQELNRNNQAFMFVTAWVGIYDPVSGTLEYVSAGHNPPLLKRASGGVEWLRAERRQKPLAAFSGSTYQSTRIALAPGDRLFLYTDGVTEAMNPKGELFGEKRLEAVLQDSGESLEGAVKAALKQFTVRMEQADDITMLTMEVKR